MVGEKRRLLHRPRTMRIDAAASASASASATASATTSTATSNFARRQHRPPPSTRLVLPTSDQIQTKVAIMWSFLAILSWMTTPSMMTLSSVKSFPLFALACERQRPLSSSSSLMWTSSGSGSGSAAAGIASRSVRETKWNIGSILPPSSSERRSTTTSIHTDTNSNATNGTGGIKQQQSISFSERITSAALLAKKYQGERIDVLQNLSTMGHDPVPDDYQRNNTKHNHYDDDADNNNNHEDGAMSGRRTKDTKVVPTVFSPIFPRKVQMQLQLPEQQRQQYQQQRRQQRQRQVLLLRRQTQQSPQTQKNLMQNQTLRFEEYSKRKQDWIRRYTSLQSLKETFGTNRNRFWGDLDPISARKLYKTLLPKALLELVHTNDDNDHENENDISPIEPTPEELAPLAYQARVAAKQYARYRCRLPFTIWATLFDGYRTWRTYGTFQPLGMSYEQVWSKYQKVVMDDWKKERSQEPKPPPPQRPHAQSPRSLPQPEPNSSQDDDDAMVDPMLTDDDVAIRQISMKILESSCRTNERVDRWILAKKAKEERQRLTSFANQQQSRRRKRNQERQQRQFQRRQQRRQRQQRDRDQLDIDRIAQTLEKDVQELLQPVISSTSSSDNRKKSKTKKSSSTKRSRVQSFFGKVGATLQSWTKRSISRW